MEESDKRFKEKSLIARMQRIDRWALPWSVLGIVALGYFFTFFDITDIGIAMPAIDVQFHLSSSESLFLALSIGLIGYVIGSFVIGNLADRYGRFSMMIVTVVLMAIGSFGDAGSTDVAMLTVFRFITGLGLGADLNLVPAYVAEFSPAKERGHFGYITFFLGILGQAVTPFVGLALVPVYFNGWRYLFIVGGIIAVVAILLRAELPRSPRWLIGRGRYEEANKIISMLEQNLKMKGEVLTELNPEDINKVNIESVETKLPLSYLWRKPYIKRMLVFGLFWNLAYFGMYAYLGDAPSILTAYGIPISSSILFIAIGAIGYPIGALSGWSIADKTERKYLVLVGTVFWLLGMVIIGTKIDSVIITAGAFIVAYGQGFILGIAYMYTSESYPTKARTSGFAMGDGLGHVGAAAGALLFPLLIISTGFFLGFTLTGIIMLVAGIIIIVGGPKATKQQLEDLST